MQDRAYISRRLKAARWLVGGTDEKGRPTPLAVSDLAALEPLASNGISSNRLEEIEQMKVSARPMELREIATALGLGGGFFAADLAELGVAVDNPLDGLLERLERRVEERLRQPDAAVAPSPKPGGELGRTIEEHRRTRGGHPQASPRPAEDASTAAGG